MKKYFLSVFLFGFLFSVGSKKSVAQASLSADATLQIMEKVAGWQLATWGKEGMRWPKTDWTNGAAYAGFMALNQKRIIQNTSMRCMPLVMLQGGTLAHGV
jgi:hypothetical protein